MANPETASVLREKIDDLSTRLLVSDLAHDTSDNSLEPFLTALRELGRQARNTGYDAADTIVTEVLANVAEAAAQDSVEQHLRHGLARLQQAIGHSSAVLPDSGGTGRTQPVFSLAQDPELIADFAVESREHLASVEGQLLTLERNPADADAIHSVFRSFHTIKGLAGFLELAAIQEVAHHVETALNRAREGELAITPAVIDIILEAVDYLSHAIQAVQVHGASDELPGKEQLLGRICSLTAASGALASQPSEPADPKCKAPQQPEAEGKRPAAAPDSLSVRVDTDKLDYLADMVGEMVIAQSLVRHNKTLTGATDPDLQRDLAQLARITGEVQRTAMAMRMIPIGQLFQRAARQVRDLSRKIGKQVELVTRGEDTELDKSIAEQLADPLMHMVRNALDHGIETPAARETAGKDPQAKITLAAYHQAGQIVIEVADDGRGLDVGRILAKARARSLVEEGAHLSESEIFRLILEPGFSTADQITDISGRGVGMDVVRKQVEKLRGRIELSSQAGQGTSFFLKLPLTLAIIDGLVVTVGKHRYIVPLFAVREMFRPAAGSMFTVQNREEMALVRGRLLPVLRLHRRFGLVPRTEDPCQALLIVAESDGHPFCLMVDDLIGKQEAVIKSLGEGVGEVPGIAGCAILGDGRVGLILDVGGLRSAHVGG